LTNEGEARYTTPTTHTIGKCVEIVLESYPTNS